MSFDNEYPNRKDKRRKYYRSKKFDRTCRPGGTCPYCKNNRTYSNEKRKLQAIDLIKEYKEDDE